MEHVGRMTAIKEYPFDYSDISDIVNNKTPPGVNMANQMPHSILSNNTEDRKKSTERKISTAERKVSIMAADPENDKYSINDSRNGKISTHQAEGPSRRKSNLHNAMTTEIDGNWDKHHIEGRFKKYSTTSTIYSKKAHHDEIEKSWWFACCQKCHQEDTTIPSWEPPHWQKFCPSPFCPSFRKTARLLTICLIGIIVWLTLWLIMKDPVAPGGQLFTLAVLTLAAHLTGWLTFKITTLPALIGMLFMGIILKNVGFVNFNPQYEVVVSYIRKIALTILLTRAGIDLDPHAMKKHFLTVIKLSLVPWTFEFVVFSILAHFLLGMPWDWAFLCGSVIAAVSPAVIVPCLLRLRKKGYGVSKGIPTLVLAVSGIDDAASVAGYGILFSTMFSSSSLVMTICLGPVSIVVGTVCGLLLGYFVKFVPEKNDSFVVPLRILFLTFGGILLELGFDEIGWGGAGPLAVITFAFIACKNWAEMGWEHDDNPVVTAVEILWMFFEPMLFSVTGAQVVIPALPLNLVLVGGGILILCTILRAVLTSVIAVKSNLNLKEKIFVGLSWSAKATVQAALALVALDEVSRGGQDRDKEQHDFMMKYATMTANLCILAIIITAPIGALIITVTGPRLLSRTTKPPILEEHLSRSQCWRRSNRPSIRDISIIDEDDLAERDAESEREKNDERPDLSTTPPDVPSSPITSQPHLANNNLTTNYAM